MNENNLAVLAYSGGLDTTYCLVYLKKVLQKTVHTVIINSGGFTPEELKKIEERAYQLGSDKHIVIDITEDFYSNCIKYLIFGNILKNNTYPLSVSAERTFQANALAQYAKENHAGLIVHGSTGAGNDQIRFDVAFSIISPETQILTPIRDFGLSRQEEIAFLKEHGIEMNWEKAKYSVNVGIWGTSVGGAETLTSHQYLPESAYPSQLKKEEEQIIEISFEQGQPIALNGEKLDPIQIIKKINQLGNDYAIGRDTHVGDTIIGIKGRVGFEAAAALILIKAHHLLEKHTLTRWQQIQKEPIADWYGTLLHEAQYLDPVMRDFEAFLNSSQKSVNGKVQLRLLPYRFEVLGINSPNDMMNSPIATYGEDNKAWDSQDAKGFIKIFGNQMKLYYSVNPNSES